MWVSVSLCMFCSQVPTSKRRSNDCIRLQFQYISPVVHSVCVRGAFPKLRTRPFTCTLNNRRAALQPPSILTRTQQVDNIKQSFVTFISYFASLVLHNDWDHRPRELDGKVSCARSIWSLHGVKRNSASPVGRSVHRIR